ncbi:MAG: TIGR03905 family TSCPD domain-containing protein [Muribaculaceae bacterium]
MKTTFMTQGTCCQAFEIETDGGVVKDVKFYGGCNGNLQGICSLIKDMPITDVIARLKGIRCGAKPTSCPDQLATALQQIIEKEK